MQTVNFRKHPFRRIFTEVAEELSRQRGKVITPSAIRLAYHRGQPETLMLVTAKVQSRLLLAEQHFQTMNAVQNRPYL